MQEKFHIKSLLFVTEHLFFYSTPNHVKYALVNGDHGIVKCMEKVVYLTLVAF